MTLARLTAAIGRGLFAGAVGTAAMTVSSTLESKIRNRGPSTAPAEAAGKLLGVEPRSEDEEQRFSQVVHWGYGTAWGAARGVIGALGLTGPAAAAAHFAAVWGAEQVMLPSLGVAPPSTRWGAKEVGVDALHHAVYATATSAAFELIDRDAR